MRVISCIFVEHNLWLVLLAAAVCVTGCSVTLNLFQRALRSEGLQRLGWNFQAAVAAGSSVWCTHFVAMLAYEVPVPITFDPILTIVSLAIAIAGFGVGFTVASNSKRFMPQAGGVIVGLTVPVMHYTGMAAYHVDGLVTWDAAYVAASIAVCVAISIGALSAATQRRLPHNLHIAIGLLVLAIVSLHFTGMAAVTVAPLMSDNVGTNPAIFETMAIAIAGVALFIVGTGVASSLIDTRSRNENVIRLQQLALYDTLTGLPNRTNFSDRVDADITNAASAGRKLAVVGIDLNRFKEINDLRGHTAGDQALKIVAQRVTRMLKDGEFAARIGGDEFGALKSFADQNDLHDFVSRLEKALFEPIQIDDFRSGAGASIGVAIFPDDGTTRQALVGNADLAMYRAKADLTKAVCFYETRLDEAARERRALALDLNRALELGQLDLYYQVQTSVATGEICGYEALLRWKHPERGTVPPMQFIPVAEENGSILSIGAWVLREACHRAASWAMPHKIAVNLSPVQFADAELPRLVHQILTETGLSPGRLELEITESAIIADKSRALHILRQIRALGVTVALDDFGTGYSSLDTLRSFPFNKIKLDRMFMNEVEHSPQSKAIIRAVLALGKSLDVPVLAEGVETASQLNILRSEGCDEAQGYLLGRPVPHDLITAAEDGPVVKVA